MVFEVLNSSLPSLQNAEALSNPTMLSYTYNDVYAAQRATMIAVIVIMVVFGLIFLGGCITVCVKSGPKVFPGRVIQTPPGAPSQGGTAPPPAVPYGGMVMPPQYKQ